MNTLINGIKWILLLALFGISLITIINYDIRKTALVGDQASHALQALSIANDFDLKFDAKDEQSWKNLGWKENPNGLYFQKYSGGYAFAKPYAYSLYTSVFIAKLDAKGFVVGNIIILVLLNIFIYLTLIKQYSKNISLGFTFAFTFFSYVYFYIYTIHTDLFLALLVSVYVYTLASLQANKKSYLFYFLSVLLAFILVDKITILFVLLPITVYLTKDWPRRDIGLFIALFVLCFFVFSTPYLYYSDFNSWNPYSGERYVSKGSVPFFNSDDVGGYTKIGTKKFFKPSYLIDNLFSTVGIQTKLSSLYYYFFGSFTGILVYAPMSFIVIASSMLRIRKESDMSLALTLTGLFLYVLFYVILFPSNYYGGYQSLGNRYFLQVSPIIILLLLYLRMNKWQCILTISLSFLLSFAFIYKHHFDPQRAYAKILRIGFFQSTMPFENTQKSLVKNIPSYQKVNLGLLPASPTYFKVDKKSLVYDERQDKLIQNSEIFLKEGALIFHKTELNNSELFVGRGFYKTEARHIWSRKQSQILIQNKNQLVKLTLESFVADNKVRIAFNDTVHNFTLNNKGTFVIDLSGFSRDWVLIEFSAEKSGRPSKITPKSNDNRDLSFSIRLGKSQTL